MPRWWAAPPRPPLCFAGPELKKSYRNICFPKAAGQLAKQPLSACQQDLQLAGDRLLDQEHGSDRWEHPQTRSTEVQVGDKCRPEACTQQLCS